ncbi:hypothetical protein HK100_006887 [Physocladia obscura]|uniref:Uncharacterized protein n=1 Tax=Physocladia obscura TaxID=109957 RepID=A0AAD5XK84_9FUNG|nr:hypothetical protein HK100_006887 [Physocladia obscura]
MEGMKKPGKPAPVLPKAHQVSKISMPPTTRPKVKLPRLLLSQQVDQNQQTTPEVPVNTLIPHIPLHPQFFYPIQVIPPVIPYSPYGDSLSNLNTTPGFQNVRRQPNFSVQQQQHPRFIFAPPMDYNILIPSDNPAECARREWEEERVRLRVWEKREQAARVLAEDEKSAQKALDDALKIKIDRENVAKTKRSDENKAAISIQKIGRGYITRKKFPSIHVNDIMLVKNVELYFLEKCILELITELAATSSLIAHRAKYHLIEMIASQLIQEYAFEVFKEVTTGSFFGRPTYAPLEPGTDTVGGYLCDIVDKEIKSASEETYNDTIKDLLSISRANIAFEVIFEQVLDEMDLIHDSLLEELVEYTYIMLLDTYIEHEIMRFSYYFQSELKKNILISKKHNTAESTSVTLIVESIIDGIFANRLVQHISSRGTSFVEYDAGTQFLDAILANILVQKYFTLRDVEFDLDSDKK